MLPVKDATLGSSFGYRADPIAGLRSMHEGLDFSAETGTPVAINGHRSRIIGRVSMDMMTIELNGSHEGLGAEVELWGDIINVNEVAQSAETIAYEILCDVKRAKFVYIE